MSEISAVYAADASDRIPVKTLTQTDFLKVMVAQLAQQDPFKAADSSKFMNDFMTMGNFQAMQDVSNNMTLLYGQNQIMYAYNLAGKTVEVSPTGEEPVTGTIESVRVQNGTVVITINGVDYNSADVTKVINPQPQV